MEDLEWDIDDFIRIGKELEKDENQNFLCNMNQNLEPIISEGDIHKSKSKQDYLQLLEKLTIQLCNIWADLNKKLRNPLTVFDTVTGNITSLGIEYFIHNSI
ncbi:unnamed protein product [Paramecium octaurelia]|uniref:Uncharacterized protein n=1 Tax=Paramecium octaurelia TaxID=43137 RepID=A0A8S1YNH3_PAROT|nr:unnamed protein product [Paramecium octaurelia]